MNTVYYDSRNLACRMEITLLRRLGRDMAWQDLNAPGFDCHPLGIDDNTLRSALHLRDADGSWITGIAAVRTMYRHCRLSWLAALSEWAPLRPGIEAAYSAFARRHARNHPTTQEA